MRLVGGFDEARDLRLPFAQVTRAGQHPHRGDLREPALFLLGELVGHPREHGALADTARPHEEHRAAALEQLDDRRHLRGAELDTRNLARARQRDPVARLGERVLIGVVGHARWKIHQEPSEQWD